MKDGTVVEKISDLRKTAFRFAPKSYRRIETMARRLEEALGGAKIGFRCRDSRGLMVTLMVTAEDGRKPMNPPEDHDAGMRWSFFDRETAGINLIVSVDTTEDEPIMRTRDIAWTELGYRDIEPVIADAACLWYRLYPPAA